MKKGDLTHAMRRNLFLPRRGQPRHYDVFFKTILPGAELSSIMST